MAKTETKNNDTLNPSRDVKPDETAEKPELSYLGQINKHALETLQYEFNKNPHVDLREALPANYARQWGNAVKSLLPQDPVPLKKEYQPPKFRRKLNIPKTASVVFPLSDKVEALLAQYNSSDPTDAHDKRLLHSLRQLADTSPTLWECPSRGIVLKCSADIVLKILTNNHDYTEYTSLQYLANHAPDIPAPRPHGLIDFPPFMATFVTYIPSMTLEDAWPQLSQTDKISIQHQLNDIFLRLRQIRQDDGAPLGGVCGEGVKDDRWGLKPYDQVINTAAGFDEFVFSLSHHGSRTYTQFLRNLLPVPPTGAVFTHGDVRMANIMVDKNKDDGEGWTVTGIIDWEDGGFYPEYHECVTLTRTLSAVDEDDWFLYVPECLSAAKFPVQWLVHRLWGILTRGF